MSLGHPVTHSPQPIHRSRCWLANEASSGEKILFRSGISTLDGVLGKPLGSLSSASARCYWSSCYCALITPHVAASLPTGSTPITACIILLISSSVSALLNSINSSISPTNHDAL